MEEKRSHIRGSTKQVQVPVQAWHKVDHHQRRSVPWLRVVLETIRNWTRGSKLQAPSS